MCSFQPLDHLIIEHVISMVAMSKPTTQHELLSVQEKLDFMDAI